MTNEELQRINQKLGRVCKDIIVYANYKIHQQMTAAILGERFLSNPITHRAIARYIWDLHSMNFN